MTRVLLIHWHDGEWAERVDRLRRAGFEVDPFCFTAEAGASMKSLTRNPPDAFVIDLGRLPSHGKAVAVVMRQTKATRGVPIVFVDGEAEKVARVREMLPDATYATWKNVAARVSKAIRRPPTRPVVPVSLSGYSGTPLPKKLGVKPGSRVVLLGGPKGFAATLGELPDGAKTTTSGQTPGDVVLFFVNSQAALLTKLPAAEAATANGGRLWMLWPKKASRVPTDVTEDLIRDAGLSAGWVDYKVAAIDAVWAGLCFARKRG
jgi:hypothetical protein